MVTYHKYDDHGDTQVYAARFRDEAWEMQRLSDWAGYRWAFQGGVSIAFEVHVGAVQPAGQGQLSMAYAYPRGRGTWVLDEATLRPRPSPADTGGAAQATSASAESSTGEPSDDLPAGIPGLQLRTSADLGQSGQPGISFRLRWYTLGPNRDRPRSGPLPPPTRLQVETLTKP